MRNRLPSIDFAVIFLGTGIVVHIEATNRAYDFACYKCVERILSVLLARLNGNDLKAGSVLIADFKHQVVCCITQKFGNALMLSKDRNWRGRLISICRNCLRLMSLRLMWLSLLYLIGRLMELNTPARAGAASLRPNLSIWCHFKSADGNLLQCSGLPQETAT